MSILVQGNDLQRDNTVSNRNYAQGAVEGIVFTKECAINQTNESEEMNTAEDLELFKKNFYEELSQMRCHGTVSNLAIKISDEAFENMKKDPAYKEKVLSLINRDMGSSFAPRDCSLFITVGATSEDYRADAWPIIADSEFGVRSQNSFYKRTSENYRAKKKELLEQYLKEQQENYDMKKRMQMKARSTQAIRNLVTEYYE